MIRELAKFAGVGQQVRLTRRFPSEYSLNGYILSVSKSLVLMHVFHDFEPDGYVICRVEDVTHLRHCPYEEWHDHMLRAEGLLRGLKLECEIDLSDMRLAIKSINRHYEQMIVECEDKDKNVKDFYIGKLLSTSEQGVLFRDYDAMGFWTQNAKSIRLADITQVQFDTPYINIFSKYTREGRPPKFPEYDG